nr:hypothetical protein [Tanacetum cinerariifolium]
MPPKDEVLPTEEQPLPIAVSTSVDLPRYILESDLKEDDKELEEDPADYLTDREDEEEEEQGSSRDDADDEDEDEDEEDDHPALADSIPPLPVHRTTARISIPTQEPVPFLSEAEFERLLTLPTPPPSPLTPYSSPLPQIPSKPLPASPTYPLGYRAAIIRLRSESPSTSYPPPPIVLPYTRVSMAMIRADAPSTYILAPLSGTPPLLPIPLLTSSPLLLLPSTDHRVDVPEHTLPPMKRLCIAIRPKFKVGESSSALTARPTGGFRVYYGFVGTLDYEITRDPKRDDTNEIYGRLDDAQDDGILMSGQLNSLRRDRRSHARTTRLMESEARISCEAWAQSMDASDTTQMAALQRQHGSARGPTHPGVPKEKMAPKRTTRSTPAITKTTTTTLVANAQLRVLIDQGVADAFAAHDADRSQNGEDNHDSGTGVRRQAPPARECLTDIS